MDEILPRLAPVASILSLQSLAVASSVVQVPKKKIKKIYSYKMQLCIQINTWSKKWRIGYPETLVSWVSGTREEMAWEGKSNKVFDDFSKFQKFG